jgi:opacity protein-like surface antigen
MKRTVLLLSLVALAATAPAAFAQSDLGFKRFGGALGYVDPEGVGSTFSLGIFADHGTIAPHIGLESHLDYWKQSEDVFGTGSSLRDISLGARVKYLFQIANPKIRPFAGVGLGMHFLKAEVTVPAFGPFPATSVEASDTKLGLDLGGGLSTPVSPKMDLLGETWFGFVDTANTFTLRAALSYKLGS